MRSKDGRVRALPWPCLGEGYLSPGLFILLGIPRSLDGGGELIVVCAGGLGPGRA